MKLSLYTCAKFNFVAMLDINIYIVFMALANEFGKIP